MLKVTFFGTTTLLFDDGKDQIFFDAHFTRPSIKQYLRGELVRTNTELCDQIIKRHKIDRLRAIFISHTHHDHVMDAPYIANRCGDKIYGSESAKNVAIGGKVKKNRIEVFEEGDCFTLGDYKIKVIKALHSKPTIINDNIGQPITEPLVQPTALWNYFEGGSYDFYVEHGNKKIMLHPSFNYIEGKLDGFEADVLFLGVAGLAKASVDEEKTFFAETAEKTNAHLIIPVHWDNFFSPLNHTIEEMPEYVDKSNDVFFKTARYCSEHDVNFLIQYPCTSIDI